MRLSNLFVILYDYLNNIKHSKIEKPYSNIFYIIEPVDWVIKWEGKYITEKLNNYKLFNSRLSTTYRGIYNQIIHFGSVNTFFTSKGFRKPHKSNKVVLTWYHVTPEDRRINFVKEAQKYIDIIHTTSTITKEKFLDIGIPYEKIVVIPLGVDINLFKPVSPEEKQGIRREIGIPADRIVIGSFQKDGVGWGDGLEPKWIKGPDIFIEVIDKLKEQDIFVLLTGPARGYVKMELDKREIPYKHFFIQNYEEIPKYYNALDLYLVTSRVEGGPKAILESMATGIPIVSTMVGMAPDIIKDGYNGFIAEVDDISALSEKALKVIEDKQVSNYLINNALAVVKDYSWEKIARQYNEQIYRKLNER